MELAPERIKYGKDTSAPGAIRVVIFFGCLPSDIGITARMVDVKNIMLVARPNFSVNPPISFESLSTPSFLKIMLQSWLCSVMSPRLPVSDPAREVCP